MRKGLKGTRYDVVYNGARGTIAMCRWGNSPCKGGIKFKRQRTRHMQAAAGTRHVGEPESVKKGKVRRQINNIKGKGKERGQLGTIPEPM